MKNRKSLIPLLIILPFLMANAPAPSPTYGKYEDVSFNVVSCTPVDYGEGTQRYNYVFEVTNTGNLYAMGSFVITTKDNDYQKTLNCQKHKLLFKNEVLAPGQTERYTYSDYYELSNDLITYVSTNCLIIEDTNVKYSDITITADKDRVRTYNVKMKTTNLGDYYYGAVFDVNYKGQAYSFTANAKDNIKFYTDTVELDLTQLEVTNVRFFRSSYNTYKVGRVIAAVINVMIGCFIFFVVAGITAAIVVPIAVSRRRRRRKLAQEKRDN